MFDQHPPGLLVCFAVELWERFSFYGMRALFIFFLIQHLLYPEQQAYLIYGAYAAMVYLMPVAGGFVADRFLGARKSILFGGVMVALGHLTLAFEGPAAVRALTAGGEAVVRDPFYLTLFFIALAQIVVGVSFIKTSCMTLVGALYGPDDPRRDSGFTLYYMSINIGGAIAPILCGWLAKAYGFRYGFGLAAIGMLIGLYTFMRGQHHLRGLSEPPAAARIDRPIIGGITREWAIYALAFVMVALVSVVLRYPAAIGVLIAIVAGCMAAILIHDIVFRCAPAERGQLIACGVLLLFTIGFWAFYAQMDTSLIIFADRYVDRRVFGFEVTAPMLQGLPAIFVLILAPLLSKTWLALARRGREPATPAKFAVATAFLASGFLTLGLGIQLSAPDSRIALGWLVVNFALLVAGELCLAPMSQSMVTRLAPRRIVGVMAGCLLLTNSASIYLSSLMASLPTGHGTAGYAAFYTRLGLIALLVCLALLLVSPMLKRLMREAPAP